jgi:hypothetical protein
VRKAGRRVARAIREIDPHGDDKPLTFNPRLDAVLVSATTGAGMDGWTTGIEERIPGIS